MKSNLPDSKKYQSPSSSRPKEALLVVESMVFPIDNTSFSIGRDLRNDLVLNDQNIAPFHAVIKYEQDQFVLIDKTNSKSLCVNEQPILKCNLFPGDVIRISHISILFMSKHASFIDKARKITGQLKKLVE